MHLRFMAFVVLAAFVCAAQSPPSKPLPVAPLTIETGNGPVHFTVEVATDRDALEYGLMNRTSMPADHGMLFDFGHSQEVNFWMKNTIIPLDMLFIRQDGTIARIKANAKPYSLDPILSGAPVRAVLEINGGRAKALGIQRGDSVIYPIFGAGH